MPAGLIVLDIDTNVINPFSGNTVTVNGVEVNGTSGLTIALGDAALSSVTSGNTNIAIGDYSLPNLTTGTNNVALGTDSGKNIKTTSSNTYLGDAAGSAFSGGPGTGNNNTAVGARSGYNTLGNNNTFLGYNAGGNNSVSGDNNICIGVNSEPATLLTNNSITLGNSSHTIIRAAVTSITALSDARDKKDVKELSAGLEFLKGLKPVEFVWNDRSNELKRDVKDFGFIAQDLKQSQEDAGLADTLKLVYDENPEKLEASYGKLIPILVKAIQDLTAKVEVLESKNKK
jgi:hypothetical protein